MEKILFIVNPTAGRGKTLKSLPIIESFLKSGKINYDIELTKYPKHATQIASRLQRDYERIVCIGGDGTLNEVINGLDKNYKTIVGLLPIGTGNDFAYSLNLSKDIHDNLLLVTSRNANSGNLEYGKVEFWENGSKKSQIHHFVNAFGVGFDAFVGSLHKNQKFFRGLLSYIIAVFKGLAEYRYFYSNGTLDDESFSGKKLLITVAKGKTSGGGFFLTPHADLFDEKLAVCLVDYANKFKFIRSLPLALINKLNLVREVNFLKCTRMEFELNQPCYIHTDGEILSELANKIKIELLKSSIKVIRN